MSSSSIGSLPLDRTMILSIRFSNSRMFPGQWYRRRTSIALSENPGILLLKERLNLLRKCFARRGMSSLLSRRGGIEMGTTLRRKKRSWRNFPLKTLSSRLVLVAEMTRISTLMGLFDPIRSISLSWRTRSSFAWRSDLNAEISSRKRVPPLAYSNFPMVRVWAPVKAPFSWPNISLSISSGGMAAQLTATKGPFFLLPWRWMARAISSLPVPLSPMIKMLVEV